MADQRIDDGIADDLVRSADPRGARRGRHRPALLGARRWPAQGGVYARSSRSTRPRSIWPLPATPPRMLPGALIAVSAAEPLLPVGPVRGFRRARVRRAGGRSARGGAGRRGCASRSTIAAGEQRRRRPRSTPSRRAAGVCRDYAHLLVALARAGGIPARCVVGLCAGRRSARFPCGRRTVARRRLAAGRRDRHGACGDIARVVVGRDATDIAFMTVFGQAHL